MEVLDSIKHTSQRQTSITLHITTIFHQIAPQWLWEEGNNLKLGHLLPQMRAKTKWRSPLCTLPREMQLNSRRLRQRRIILASYLVSNSRHSCFSNNSRHYRVHPEVLVQENNHMLVRQVTLWVQPMWLPLPKITWIKQQWILIKQQVFKWLLVPQDLLPLKSRQQASLPAQILKESSIQTS